VRDTLGKSHRIRSRAAAVLALGAAAVIVAGPCAKAGGETVALPAGDDAPEPALIGERLSHGYPGIVRGVEGGNVVLWDGVRLPLDDGRGKKSFEAWLSAPDIADMFALAYPPGPLDAPAAANFDPGRARNAAFFKKVYGDCRVGGVKPALVDVTWLPRKAGQVLKVTSINGVAARFAAISAELDELPPEFDGFLFPAAGAYNCRNIAGTNTPSAHGYGIAIDIAVRHASYWRWEGGKGGAAPAYRNKVPMEIVRVFEKHGFIWGGKWNHFDTMHFEYRPELLAPVEDVRSPGGTAGAPAPPGGPAPEASSTGRPRPASAR